MAKAVNGAQRPEAARDLLAAVALGAIVASTVRNIVSVVRHTLRAWASLSLSLYSLAPCSLLPQCLPCAAAVLLCARIAPGGPRMVKLGGRYTSAVPLQELLRRAKTMTYNIIKRLYMS